MTNNEVPSIITSGDTPNSFDVCVTASLNILLANVTAKVMKPNAV